MAEAVSPGGKSLIVMSSAKRGNPRADLKDLKLGKYTASGTDQTRRGTSGIGTTTKTLQHDWMDVVSVVAREVFGMRMHGRALIGLTKFSTAIVSRVRTSCH